MKAKVGSLTVEQHNEGEWFLLWQTDPGPGPEERVEIPVVRLEPVDALGLLRWLKQQEPKFKESLVQEILRRTEARR